MKISKAQRLAESHQRQFDGEDAQAVSIDICRRHDITFEDDEHQELQIAPSPDCDCVFCKTAPWED